jgi:hypothetical protein
MYEKCSILDGGKRISGRYVVRDGMVTVTAGDGRAKQGLIEDCMLSPETLAKTLLLQLHRKKTTNGAKSSAATLVSVGKGRI